MVQTIGEQQNISHFFEHWKTEHCRITEQTPTILILNMFGIPASTGFTNIFRPYFIENQAIQIKKSSILSIWYSNGPNPSDH